MKYRVFASFEPRAVYWAAVPTQTVSDVAVPLLDPTTLPVPNLDIAIAAELLMSVSVIVPSAICVVVTAPLAILVVVTDPSVGVLVSDSRESLPMQTVELVVPVGMRAIASVPAFTSEALCVL